MCLSAGGLESQNIYCPVLSSLLGFVASESDTGVGCHALPQGIFPTEVNRLPAMWESRVQSLAQEDSLEKEMATHSSTLAWKIAMD